MKRLIATLVAALAAGFYLGVPAAASATEQPEPVCATWAARGATGAYPDVTFGGKPEGTVITTGSAKLTKPEGVSPGVEFASFDLGIGDLAQEAIVYVEYATSDGASTAAGAVRMFAYYDKDADTLNDAPDHVAIASAESGNLLFTVPAGKKIGTLGLVFDASNNTTGAVTFTGLKIGERPVSFTPCPAPTTQPTTTAPTTPPTTAPTTTVPTTVPTTTPATDPTGTTAPTTAVPTTATPSPSTSDKEWTCAMFNTSEEAQAAFEKDPIGLAELDGDGDGYACEYQPGGGLPLTGPGIGLVVAFGLALIGTAVALLILVRRRRLSFTA